MVELDAHRWRIMSNSKFTPEPVTDPELIARFQAEEMRSQRNRVWFDAHRSDLYDQAAGRAVAVAGEEAFVADSYEEAEAWARVAHPDADGVYVVLIPCKPPPIARIATPFFIGPVAPLRWGVCDE